MSTILGGTNLARHSKVIVFLMLLGLLWGGSSWAQDPWTQTGNMVQARGGHTATLLADGKILIAGGEDTAGPVSVSELFDPATGQFTAGAALNPGRADHRAVLLPDGKVLIIGGRDSSGPLTSTLIYEPTAGSFVPGPNLNRPRTAPSVTVLQDGKILVAGGDAEGTAEIYLPENPPPIFALVSGRLAVPRAYHGAALMPSGKVLIAGGADSNNNPLNSAEVFDPVPMTFSPASTVMGAARSLPLLRVLPDGKVQVIGGDAGSTMEMFDPAGGGFNALSNLPPSLDMVTPPPSIPNLLSPTLSTQSRAALITKDIGNVEAMQGFISAPLLGLLDRSDYSLTEIPQLGKVLVVGAFNSADHFLASAYLVSTSSATVTTDKTDYPPGEVVTITGSGFARGEEVWIIVHEMPWGYEDSILSATADANGNLTNTQFSPQPIDVGRTFTLTAIGQSSGFTAQTMFTDAINLKILGSDGSQHQTSPSEENLGIFNKGTNVILTCPRGSGLSVQATGIGGGSQSWNIAYYGTDFDNATLSSLTTLDPPSGTLTGSSDTNCVAMTITTSTLSTKTYHGVLRASGTSANPGDYYFKFTVTTPADSTAPTINCNVPDQGIWYAANVTVNCTASDATGLATPADANFSLATTVSAGTETDIASTGSKTVCDIYNNCATAGPYTFKVDKKAPTVSCGSADTTWHATDQSVTCTATDGGSGPASQTVTLSTSVASGTETDNAYTNSQSVSDAVGNSATAGPVGPYKIDKKAPSNIIFVGDISEGGTYELGSVPPAPTCTATDGGSGLKSCEVTGYSNAIGSHTLTATATDNVNNSSTKTLSYKVIYKFTGFFRPVDNLPSLNGAKAGSAIPVKFSLNGNQGLNIFAATYPKSQVIACESGIPTDAIEETVTAGGSSLNYDPATDQYIYVWKTDKAWAGGCRQLIVILNDGTDHRANFKFTK